MINSGSNFLFAGFRCLGFFGNNCSSVIIVNSRSDKITPSSNGAMIAEILSSDSRNADQDLVRRTLSWRFLRKSIRFSTRPLLFAVNNILPSYFLIKFNNPLDGCLCVVWIFRLGFNCVFKFIDWFWSCTEFWAYVILLKLSRAIFISLLLKKTFSGGSK